MDCIIIFISTINLRKAKLALLWLITESILAEVGSTKVEDQNCANYPFEDQNWVINKCVEVEHIFGKNWRIIWWVKSLWIYNFGEKIRAKKKNNWGSNRLDHLEILEEISWRGVWEYWRTNEVFNWWKLVNKFGIATKNIYVKQQWIKLQKQLNWNH